ncbi:hypothetical protein CK203_104550 [Vitis vinifera]|uniref:Uncharacterized protein n=1 Tax=Vitis vinifera TaxID=29760 RepID=A0A438FGL2_VITVI|nr:hypothetical protein CK203_104550 [Vitis vinifera]
MPHQEPPTGEAAEPSFPQHHSISLRRIGSSRWGCNYGDACFPNRALKWYIVCKKWTSGCTPKVRKKTAAAVLFASLHFACFSSLLLFACARVST